MDQELTRSMFLRAHEQYESAVRWTVLATLAALSFHLMVFSPFLAVKREQAMSKMETERLSALVLLVDGLAGDLKSLDDGLGGVLKTEIEHTLEALRSDFDALDRAVAALDTPTASSFTTTGADRLLDDQPSPLQAPQRVPRVFALDEDLKVRLSEAKTMEELRTALMPVINQQILAPRFEELNRHWRETVVPDLHRLTTAVVDRLNAMDALRPDGAGLREEIEASITRTAQAAAGLTFQPASSPDWWSSVAGKQTELSAVRHAAEKQLDSVAASEAFAKLRTEVAASVERQKKLQEAVAAQLANIEENFKQLQRKVASMGKAFELFALDLSVLVSKFPLLLGILLASITVWVASRLAVLASAVRLVAEANHGTPARKWVGGALRPSALWLTPASLALLACAWIALTGWEIARGGEVGAGRAALLAAGGCLAVVVAQAYRRNLLRSVIALRDAVAESSSHPSSPR